MNIDSLIQTILIYALPVLFAITIHEAAHGYVARHFGDDTAWMLGRVTLNPLKHIDPIGTVALPLLLLFTTAAIPGGPFILGYAKPVPVNFGALRHPKRDMIWVAAAGPLSNFIQALGWTLFLMVLIATEVDERFFISVAQAGIVVNLVLAIFNLLPIPPLDGGRVMVGVLPRGAAYQLSRVEPFGFFVVLGLLVAGVLSTWWITPLLRASYSILVIPLLSLVR